MSQDHPGPLQVVGLTAGYREELVVGKLSFELPPLQVTAVVGPGGAGKTTLLWALSNAATRPPDLWCRGDVTLGAEALHLMPQKPAGGPASLDELLAMKGRSIGLEEVWAPNRAAADALRPVAARPIAELENPLRRLAVFTAAVATTAPLLLFDEPDLNIGEPFVDWMAAKIRQLSGQRTVVVVSHHLGFVRRIADVVMLLVDGEIVETAPAKTFFESPRHPRTRDYVRWGS